MEGPVLVATSMPHNPTPIGISLPAGSMKVLESQKGEKWHYCQIVNGKWVYASI